MGQRVERERLRIIWSGCRGLVVGVGLALAGGLAWWVVDDLGYLGSCVLTGVSGSGR